jgi:hypothetical protein
VRLRTIASTGGELPQLDGVMILGHIGMNAWMQALHLTEQNQNSNCNLLCATV